jgi:hypothetical protein
MRPDFGVNARNLTAQALTMRKAPPTAWKPGQSGNPGGRMKGVAEVEALAREYSRPALITLAKIMEDEKAPHAARVSAATHLLDRGLGKPKQPTELTGADGTPLFPVLAVTIARLTAGDGRPVVDGAPAPQNADDRIDRDGTRISRSH